MSASGPPVFYYDTNSPYAYLAAHRIGDLIPDAVWKPVALPIIFRAIGKLPWSMSDERPAGVAEIERRAAERGLPALRWHEDWPRDTWSWHPLRAAIVADDEGRQREFALAAYRVLFAEGRSLADLENVLDAARAAGLDPGEVRERIGGDEDVKERLRANTEEAIAAGAVGVPTVAVGDELYWGDDRLDEAAAAAG